MKERTDPRPQPAARVPVEKVIPWVLLALAIGLFVWHSWSVRFVQDDSYITYRYARNIIEGHGPVFNPGERVEGFTNFLWLMLISGLGIIGLSWNVIIPLTQVLGLACGVGVLVFLFLLVRRHTRGPTWFAPAASLLVSANGAFAYWCVPGMETGLFSLLICAGFYFCLGEPTPRRLLLGSGLLGLSALTRPEGALFFMLVVLHFAIARFGRDRAAFLSRANLADLGRLVVPFVLLAAPLYVWRLSYYGRLFPNTFYAKTGLSASYLKSGIQYLWDFLRAYGLWGLLPAGAALVLALRRRLGVGSPALFAVLLLAVYSAYVVAVGGDVLRIFRFFVPVLPLFYLLVVESLLAFRLPRDLPEPVRYLPGLLAVAALLPYTFIGPFARERTMRAEILRNQSLENGLVSKMAATGRWLNTHLDEDEWFACTTIGAVSFYSERRMVDMLGLTDSTIAHHPEDILGPRVYWKERNYNTRHVLSLNPAYIYFSTGAKPSAAAERALFLRTRFRAGYYPCLITAVDGRSPFTDYIYKAKPGVDTLPIETPGVDPEFVDLYNRAINLTRSRRTLDSAIAVFHRCRQLAPPDFAYPWEWIGTSLMQLRREDEAVAAFEQALAIDDWCVTSHEVLGTILHNRGQYALSAPHFARVIACAPDYAGGYLNYSASTAALGDLAAAERVLLAGVERFPMVPQFRERLNQVRAAAARARFGPPAGN